MNQHHTNQGWDKWLAGAALGAIAMYFSDPSQGRRRRALARDKMQGMLMHSARARHAALRDLDNRVNGMRARIRRAITGRNEQVDDQVLAARIRAQLGRSVSHPHMVSVTAQGGRVCLSGSIPSSEKNRLMRMVENFSQVTSIDDQLVVRGGNESSQAFIGKKPSGGRSTWKPAWRALATSGGGMLSAYGISRKSPGGVMLAIAGLALLARGLTNDRFASTVGLGSHAKTIDIQKTIDIHASPEEVFDAWEQYENFPHFMSHVLTVYDLGARRSHWIVHGPAGSRLEWNAVLTKLERPRELAWQSEPDAAVANAGTVRFEPSEHGTRVTVRMTYRPPAGALGHTLAVLLGNDPKRQLDDDLMRMKSFIESGIVPHDAAHAAAMPQLQAPEGTTLH